MKKTITIIFLMLVLGVVLPVTQVPAGEQATQKNAEQGWHEALKTQVALARAKVSMLQARTELWLEQNKAAALHSLDEARADLDEAMGSADQVTRARIAELKLQVDHAGKLLREKGQEAEDELHVKDSADKATAEQIARLQDKVQAAQQAVREEADKAKSRISALVISTEEHIQAYGKTIQESEEAKLLQKRYGQLEAKAALLKANLAAKTDATGKQTAAYLDESRAWYDSLKSQTSQHLDKELTDMSARIDEAKQAVERKDKQARTKLAELLEQAAAMLKDEESTK